MINLLADGSASGIVDVSAIVAVIGAVVTLIIGIWTWRYNYNRLFAQTVSTNRMDWINVWRENISTFLACAKVLHACNAETACANCSQRKFPDKKTDADNNKAKSFCEVKDCYIRETKQKMEFARTMITSRLNLTEDSHKLMKITIMTLDCDIKNEKFYHQCEYIEELARQILKPEWERMKDEAKGKRR